jgi:serine/threonine-protein kinase
VQANRQAPALVPEETHTRTSSTGLPPDLLAQAARRLRVQLLLYSFAFFVSNPLTAVLFPADRAQFLASPLRWAPSTISIVAALLIVAITLSRRVPVAAVLALGLVFEVIGSFGIAAAQYLDASRWVHSPPWGGLSWVAVWVLGFAVIVPNPPRHALAASLASVSAVPLTVGFVMAVDPAGPNLRPLPFFFHLVLPYLVIVVIAYVAARVVYQIGTEVTRARELGSYRLVERLGQGGMGEVWRAKHRLLARPAAIKLMRPDVLGGRGRSDEVKARFEREAQATASLRSPHTVALYDFGVADDGRFYYVMELLDGFDCDTLVERFGPVPAARAVHLLLQVCHSLAEAHANGLTHRDVKPANVLVCRYGRDEDFVKVLDFGLVKSHTDAGVTAVDVSRDHAVRGTPAFMAPEQILGHAVDGRTDIYAVGCLAYWLVTGQRVFTGTSGMDMLLKHAHAVPEPPSRRTENVVPAPLDRLVLDCLAKDPSERPASADVVRARLDDIGAADPWSPDRIHTWWQLHHPRAHVQRPAS